MLRLVYSAMASNPNHRRPVIVIYCDTGVEIPLIAGHVRSTLRRLQLEAREESLDLVVRIARPKPGDSFFVKVIGRGYPPPTNKFRWCTDRLRINPVRQMLAKTAAPRSVVLLGTRMGESSERDRVLARHQTDARYFYRQGNEARRIIFARSSTSPHKMSGRAYSEFQFQEQSMQRHWPPFTEMPVPSVP